MLSGLAVGQTAPDLPRWSKTVRNALITLGLLLAIPLLIVCLPVVLPYMAISQSLQQRRLARTPCPTCGAPFGRTEVDRARAAFAESVREIRKNAPPGARLRIVSISRLSCPE